MKPQVCDVGFSHALGHLGDRDLIVVFPEAGPRRSPSVCRSSRSPLELLALADEQASTLLEPLRPADVIASYQGDPRRLA